MVRLLRVAFLTVLCSMPIASAEAGPWELTFDGTLHMGLLTGTTFHARFIYENPLNLQPGEDIPPGADSHVNILFASVAFNNRLYFSQWAPGMLFILGGSGLYGPQFELAPQFLPLGLTRFGFAETRVIWGDTGALPFVADECQWVGSIPNFNGCTFSAAPMASQVPEPMTLTLVAIGAGLAMHRRRRRRL